MAVRGGDLGRNFTLHGIVWNEAIEKIRARPGQAFLTPP